MDDEAEVRSIFSEHLEKNGYAVDTFETGEDAFEAFSADPDKYKLALIDYNLPGIDGIMLTRKMRVINEDLPVVLISGYVKNPQKKLQFSVDVDVIMTKPVFVEQLSEVVQRFLPLNTKNSK